MRLEQNLDHLRNIARSQFTDGPKQTPAFLAQTLERMVDRAAELERRLGNYECPEHEKPDYECDVCLEHLRAAGALEEEPPER